MLSSRFFRGFGYDEDRGIDPPLEYIQPRRGAFQIPIVNFFDGIEDGQPLKPFGSLVNEIPDAHSFGINFAMAVFTRAAARSVANPFGAALAARK